MIRYEAEITGHEAPFKWQVKRHLPGSAPFTPFNAKGEADTYEDALFDAAEAARKLEWAREHESTVQVETLFIVDEDES